MERIFESEYRFMCILWEYEPISSPELVQLCEKSLGWKKSTTYTVIRKLTEKGIVRTERTIVSSIITKAEADRQAGDELLERTSNGSIPTFLAAFLKDRKLSRNDIEKIKNLIEESREDD